MNGYVGGSNVRFSLCHLILVVVFAIPLLISTHELVISFCRLWHIVWSYVTALEIHTLGWINGSRMHVHAVALSPLHNVD
jgi:hypothetical protein